LIAFIASCIYLIISFIYPLVGFKEVKAPLMKPENISGSEEKQEAEQKVKPYEFYLEGIRNRQIFSSVSTSAPIYEKEKPISSSSLEAESADLIKNINLVGIISGENSQAVIEDKKIQKTYYLTKGQFIGEFQIEDIREGKVILNYHGKRFELYL
jgi:type II secretory pathway component PulC